MLLAYIDEIGEPGAFISPDDKRYNTSPAFGYAGFIIPAENARQFGALFNRVKLARFKKEIRGAADPVHWEAKGADLFRATTPEDRPENPHLRQLGHFSQRSIWKPFYYADEKPLGTPKQTRLNSEVREREAMQETLNRIARYADKNNSLVMVLIDSINEKTRVQRVADMYAHIFSRQADFPEMRQIVEPPMHVDSKLSTNIQFADWVAAYVTRAIDRQLIEESKYKWICEDPLKGKVYGSFTNESKLHFHNRQVGDLHHSEILKFERPVYPPGHVNSIQRRIGTDNMRRIKAAAERAGRR